MSKTKPHAATSLTRFLEKRILELRPAKSQLDIAGEAGFPNPNMLSMIKTGVTRLPLDRVDVKTLHAKIGQLTLENDFLEGALTKAGLLSVKR